MVMMAANVSARIEGRWALQSGDVIVGEDISVQHPMATIFHQQTSSAVDLEHLDLSFPLFADGLNIGPAIAGAGATANVLPFGPVNLAFPSIHEDALQSVNTSSTGYFTANWAYITDTAAGNLGSEPLGIYLGSGHPLKSPSMLGSEFLWPLMVPISAASASTGNMMFDLDGLAANNMIGGDILQNNSILASVPIYHTPRISFSTNATGASDNNTSHAQPSRMPRINPKAIKEEITGMTTMQRMYRNAFIGSTMYKAYEGPTQYPVWIDPYDNGAGVFNQIDMQKILQVAHMKTLPGERIAPVFWDI
jgi:hypothetical protein